MAERQRPTNSIESLPDEWKGWVLARYAMAVGLDNNSATSITNAPARAVKELHAAHTAGVLQPPLGPIANKHIEALVKGDVTGVKHLCQGALAVALEERAQMEAAHQHPHSHSFYATVDNRGAVSGSTSRTPKDSEVRWTPIPPASARKDGYLHDIQVRGEKA